MSNSAILQEISEKIQKGKTKDIKALVPKALEEGVSASDILSSSYALAIEGLLLR